MVQQDRAQYGRLVQLRRQIWGLVACALPLGAVLGFLVALGLFAASAPPGTLLPAALTGAGIGVAVAAVALLGAILATKAIPTLVGTTRTRALLGAGIGPLIVVATFGVISMAVAGHWEWTPLWAWAAFGLGVLSTGIAALLLAAARVYNETTRRTQRS